MRQPGEPRHLHPVTAIRRPLPHLVQEDHLALPFLDRHRGIRNPGQLARQSRHLVIMGGKQRPTPVHVVQMLQRRPGNRQPVIGRRPPPDLIQDHQRPVIRLIEDRRRFHHLDHEGRPAPCQIIRRPDPAEQLADQPQSGRLRRHITPDLGQQCYHRILPQKRRLTRHIRPGQQPDRRRFAFGQPAIIRYKRHAFPLQAALHHRMPPAHHVKRPAVIDDRCCPILRHRQIGQRRRQIQFRQTARRPGNRRSPCQNRRLQRLKMRPLLLQRQISGIENPGLHLAQLHGGEPHHIRIGLPMDEPPAAQQLLGMHRGHFNKIPQHIVMLDLQ